jgi:hypothetical protein
MNQNMMNMNNGNVFPQQQTIATKKLPLEYILYGCMALAIIGCFLPFATFSESFLNTKATTNYVMYNDELKDGVFIIGMLLAVFFMVFKKKNYKTSIGLLIASTCITIYDFMDIKSVYNEQVADMPSLKEYLHYNYEIGSYMVLIGLIGALITAFMLYKENKNVVQPVVGAAIPQPMMYNQQMQQPGMNNQMVNPNQGAFITQPQPVQAKCQYCGSDRNAGNYCNSCGGQY